MREYREADEVDFAIVGTGAGGGTWRPCCRARLFGRGVRCRRLTSGRSKILRPTKPNRTSSTGLTSAWWTVPIPFKWAVEFGQVGGRLDGALRHGVVALSARVVHRSLIARLWSRLAHRLAGNVALLWRGREADQCFGAIDLPVGSEAAALPLPSSRTQHRRSVARQGAARPSASAGPRRRWRPFPHRIQDPRATPRPVCTAASAGLAARRTRSAQH